MVEGYGYSVVATLTAQLYSHGTALQLGMATMAIKRE